MTYLKDSKSILEKKKHFQITCDLKVWSRDVLNNGNSQVLSTFEVHQVSNVLLRYPVSRSLNVTPQIFKFKNPIYRSNGNFKLFPHPSTMFFKLCRNVRLLIYTWTTPHFQRTQPSFFLKSDFKSFKGPFCVLLQHIGYPIQAIILAHTYKILCLTLKEPGYFDPSHSRGEGGGFRPPLRSRKPIDEKSSVWY